MPGRAGRVEHRRIVVRRHRDIRIGVVAAFELADRTDPDAPRGRSGATRIGALQQIAALQAFDAADDLLEPREQGARRDDRLRLADLQLVLEEGALLHVADRDFHGADLGQREPDQHELQEFGM